jgi:hypothetical protein
VIIKKNFAGVPVGDIPVDTEYKRCNFARPAPELGPPVVGVRLFPGDDTPRTFIDCNLVNCEPPPGSTLIRCNTTLNQQGVLGELDEVILDGVPVSSVQHKKTLVYGRWNPDTESYIYEAPPIEVPERL